MKINLDTAIKRYGIPKMPNKEARKLKSLIRNSDPSSSLASPLSGTRGSRRKKVYASAVDSLHVQQGIDAAFQNRVLYWSNNPITETLDKHVFHTSKFCPAYAKIEKQYLRTDAPPDDYTECLYCATLL